MRRNRENNQRRQIYRYCPLTPLRRPIIKAELLLDSAYLSTIHATYFADKIFSSLAVYQIHTYTCVPSYIPGAKRIEFFVKKERARLPILLHLRPHRFAARLSTLRCTERGVCSSS